jgi:hypothetical protein
MPNTQLQRSGLRGIHYEQHLLPATETDVGRTGNLHIPHFEKLREWKPSVSTACFLVRSSGLSSLWHYSCGNIILVTMALPIL